MPKCRVHAWTGALTSHPALAACLSADDRFHPLGHVHKRVLTMRASPTHLDQSQAPPDMLLGNAAMPMGVRDALHSDGGVLGPVNCEQAPHPRQTAHVP